MAYSTRLLGFVLFSTLALACSGTGELEEPVGSSREAVVLLNGTFESAGSFAYVDDPFGTNAPSGASGTVSGGQAHVTLGQAPNSGANSGGWRASFTATGPVTVSFAYAIRHPTGTFEATECSEVRVTIDATTYGAGGNPYVARICGTGTASNTFSFTSSSLSAGSHTITVGSYLNGNSFADEIASFDFDNIVVSGNTTPACGDAACNGTETCSTCPADCGACPPVCGDATCSGGETCSSCPGDCGVCPAQSAFIESAGQVVMEAETFMANVSQGGNSWTADTTSTPSNGQALRSTPTTPDVTRDTGYTTTSPRLDYRVTFTQTGTYHVWVRGRASGTVGNDDSVHVGLDGAAVTSADRINAFTASFNWLRSTADGPTATLSVTTPGIHTINVWMRENGFVLDKLLLRTSTSSTAPSGAGPAQSPRINVCGDALCNGAESCSSCASDCGTCGTVCGDQICNGSETCTSCPGDCGACPACPDGSCNGSETCTSCPSDCGTCPVTCPNGTCSGGETCTTCPADCGACAPVCPDGTCNGTETCTTCPSDCGACAPVCPDGACNGSETCTTCPSDCGSCTNSGLDTRPPNPTCLAPPPIATGFVFTRRWPNIAFNQPLALLQAPGNNNEFFVVEKTGRVKAVPTNNSATPGQMRDFLNLSGVVAIGGPAEGGVLGVAFHPNYASNRFVWVSYTVLVGGTFTQRLSRFESTDGGMTLSLSTERVLFNHPKTKENHNAGTIAFGPDGYLYMSLGDDSYMDFTRALMAADPNNLYGKLLRVNPSTAPTNQSPAPPWYTIPSTNPFASGGGRGEVWAYGLRNPWRFSFDRTAGDLWLADVGEDTWEEFNRIEKGGFYGWPHREADACRPSMNCSLAYKSPEYAYLGNGNGSVTGGFVYRGATIPELYGHYVYGDYVTGEIWAYDIPNRQNQSIKVGGGNLSAFGEDNAGEIYAVRHASGFIERLERQTGGGPTDFPALLTDTGCFTPGNPPTLVAGAIPYSIALPFWSDGAEKERYLALPNGTTLSVDANGDFTLPPGGVTIKNFRHQGKLFETRFFVRHSDGSYSGYTYEWNDPPTQGTLVGPAGKSRSLPGLTWTYPSRSGCFSCHTDAAGGSLGLETRQLNIASFYPSTGRTANQLVTLDHVDMLSGNLASLAPFPASDDQSAPLLDRGKAYLHVNCSNCHRPTGPGRGAMDARFQTPFADMRICNELPTLGDLGVPGARMFKPADDTGSVIWLRMSQRAASFMPPLASTIPDAAGAALLSQWIDGTSTCPTPPNLACNVTGNRITNCDFAGGTASWSMRLNSGGAGTLAVTGGELRLNVTNAGTLDWHVQAIQIFGSLNAGTYQVSFNARASAARNIAVNMGEEGDDYSSFCGQTVALTTSMQTFTVSCSMPAADNNVKLDFNVGAAGTASVFIDNVYFGPPR